MTAVFLGKLARLNEIATAVAVDVGLYDFHSGNFCFKDFHGEIISKSRKRAK